MATSPIYSWPEPDNTDLVKNGALAIRTLGNAIDTTMATMTPKSLVDAKGDLITATANDTPARLAVGNNGETLVADSSTSTGLRYQAPVNCNPVLNSAFQVWQRGTTASNPNTIATTFIADRWNFYRPAGFTTGITMSRQTTSDTTNLPFIQYCARIQRTAGNTSTQNLILAQNIESINSIPYAGKTVTLSFYARAGANFSAASSILSASIVSGTGTDENIINGLTGSTVSLATNATLTTTWQRFTVTGSIASNFTQIVPYFQYTPVGTAGANDYFEITGVQLEVGSVATPFKTYAGTIQGELAACQRYYHRFTGGGSSDSLIGSGLGFSTTVAMFVWHLGTTMRIAPSSMDLSNQGIYRPANATAYSGGTWSLNQAFDNSVRVIYTHGSAIFTAGESLIPSSTSATNFIGFSAEL